MRSFPAFVKARRPPFPLHGPNTWPTHSCVQRSHSCERKFSPNHRPAGRCPRAHLVSPVEQSLVDVNVSNIPGLTSLPHLHDLIVDGPREVTGVSDTPSRRKIFVCRPVAGADEIPCPKRILATLARPAH